MPLTTSQRLLYHQLHPAKLAVDGTTAIAALVLFWHHELVTGLLVGFVPSIIVTAVIVAGPVNLDHLHARAPGATSPGT